MTFEAWARSAANPALVVVDVLARIRDFTGREASYEADYRSLTGLQELASRLDVAVVVVHHTRKMGAEDPFDEVSGTRGLTGAADTVLVLKRESSPGGNRATLYGRGRDIAEIETALEFCEGDYRWRVLGEAHEVAATTERQEILDVLHDAGEPMSPSEIADVLDKSRPNVAKMLSKMLVAGQVTKPASGRYAPVTAVTPVTLQGAGEGGRVTTVTNVTACPRCDGDGCEWCER